MSEISVKEEERAIRLINEYYEGDPLPEGMPIDVLQEKMPGVNVKHLLDVLKSHKMVTVNIPYLNFKEYVQQTNKCASYFEDKKRETSRRRSDRAHEWMIAVFTSLAGALISKPLWDFLTPLFSRLFQR